MRGSTQREALATQKMDILICAQKVAQRPKKGLSAFLGCIYCKSAKTPPPLWKKTKPDQHFFWTASLSKMMVLDCGDAER